MEENNELHLQIVKKLDNISSDIYILKQRVENIEGKTEDIHKDTPFVEWLEKTGINIYAYQLESKTNLLHLHFFS